MIRDGVGVGEEAGYVVNVQGVGYLVAAAA
jgi:hypothetical protein